MGRKTVSRRNREKESLGDEERKRIRERERMRER